VLITGGYLVLDRPNAGIVLSTTARFYAIVRPIYDEIKPDSWAWVSALSQLVFQYFFFLIWDVYHGSYVLAKLSFRIYIFLQ
jgi:hypothetical protein